MTDLRGRCVVVTGAASGIGWEMARQFADAGATVIAADLAPDGVPAGCVPCAVDVADESSVAEMTMRAIDTAGRIDVVCNNAGLGSTGDVLACSVEDWDRLFAVNCRGVFLGTKSALPHMLEQGRGVIVNTASIAGLVGLPDRAAYCATKGAVVAFTKQVAVQYARQGIRCNCLCPGTVETAWVERLVAAADEPDVMRSKLVARQPVGRLGTAREVARAAVYLASDEAAFVTGTAFVIDGGLTAA